MTTSQTPATIYVLVAIKNLRVQLTSQALSFSTRAFLAFNNSISFSKSILLFSYSYFNTLKYFTTSILYRKQVLFHNKVNQFVLHENFFHNFYVLQMFFDIGDGQSFFFDFGLRHAGWQFQERPTAARNLNHYGDLIFLRLLIIKLRPGLQMN